MKKSGASEVAVFAPDAPVGIAVGRTRLATLAEIKTFQMRGFYLTCLMASFSFWTTLSGNGA